MNSQKLSAISELCPRKIRQPAWRVALLSPLLLSACAVDAVGEDDDLMFSDASWPVEPADSGAVGGFTGATGGSTAGGGFGAIDAGPGSTWGGIDAAVGDPPGGGLTAGGLTAGGLTAGTGGFIAGGLTAGTGGFIGGGFIGGTTGGGTGGGPATPLDPSERKPADSKLPTVNGACPNLQDGMVNVMGASVKLWVGQRPGPVVFYWHGTGSSADEVTRGLPGATNEVKSNGGIVASFQTTGGQGRNTGNGVWYTGDFDAADQILACAIQSGIADTGRIYSSGYSAGGLQTGAMIYMRSNYLASAVVYSGGKGVGAGGFSDPSNVPAMLGAHGAKGSDVLILDFADGTTNLGTGLKAAGGFAVNCDDGGGHVALSRLGVGGRAWQFLKDHPYNTKPSPYASGLPAGYPSYCKIQ